MTHVNKKDYRILGFGFVYAKTIINENDVISGGSLFVFNKQIFTIAISDTNWSDCYGEPYRFKLDGRVLFIGRIAIGVSYDKKGEPQ